MVHLIKMLYPHAVTKTLFSHVPVHTDTNSGGSTTLFVCLIIVVLKTKANKKKKKTNDQLFFGGGIPTRRLSDW